MTIALFLAAWVLPVLAAVLAIKALCPRGSRAARWMYRLIGVGVGIGFGSIGFYSWLAMGRVAGERYIVAESMVLLVVIGLLAAIVGARGGRALPLSDEPGQDERLGRLLAIGLWVAAALSLPGVVLSAWSFPYGKTDAYAIWNLHARHLFRGGEHWVDGFSERSAWSHPDYPLLWPAAVARSWCAIGAEATFAPAVLSLVFAYSIIGLICTAIAAARDRVLGALAGFAAIGADYLLRHATDQYADIPLAFFMLAAVACVVVGREGSPGTGPFVLAGVLSGLAAWTKNEGMLFAVCLASVLIANALFACRSRAEWMRIAAFFLGLLPVLLVVLHFKATYAPTNDLVAGWRASGALSRATDLSRHGQVLRYLGTTMVRFSNGVALVLAACGLLLGRRKDGRGRTAAIPAAVGAAMLCGYYWIYILTPLDLAWHMEHSARRLMLQVYPLLVFAVFLWVRSPREMLGATRLASR